jgi:salicylate hydroxylase
MEWASGDRRLVAYPCSDNKVFKLCAFLPSGEVNDDAQKDGE